MKHFLIRTLALAAALVMLFSNALAYEKLRRGDKNSDVLSMQQALNRLGYSLKEDGSFGSGTLEAVKDFQKKNGLTVDGVAGNQTLTLLYQLAAGTQKTTAPATAAPTATLTPEPGTIIYATLRKGDSGAQVLAMQQALQKLGYSLTADGKFGSGTQNTVKAFQKDHSLKDDGAAGNETLTLLYRLANSAAATTAPAATAPVTAAPGSVTATVSTVSGSLNLRAAPNSNAEVLLEIPNHAAIPVTSRGTTWCGVIYGGKAGYVMTSFLRFADDTAPTNAPTASPAPVVPADGQSAIVTTTGGTLNFRSGASTSAKIVCQIPNAAVVTVTGRGSEWCAIVYDSQPGYVMTQFLSFLTPGEDTPTDPPKPIEQQDASAFTRTLKSGMTGDDVTWVQSRLKALGYTVTVNGIYDSATVSAVKSFQTHNCLSSDGIAGSQTFTMLQSDSARKFTDSIPSYATLRVDDTGTNVTNMQNALKKLGYPVTVNGTYDVDTHNAVVAFQQRSGLVISGIADGITLSVLYGGGGKPYSTPVASVDLSAHRMSAPSVSSMKLLKWYDEVKPGIKTGQTALIYDPGTGLSWHIKFYSLGHHADSEPLTWEDTQVMNASFGKTAWTVHPVYVQLPSGQWTMATMHNRPHLYGSIMNNGFGGHLCVHFLRDVSECISAGDKDYGVQNQRTLRSAWKALTGETIPEN